MNRLIMTGKLAIIYCSSWQVIFLFSYRHHREKKEDAPEPEADPERDQRTVFAYQVFPVTCLLSVK